MKIRKAVIPAAGLGTRFLPATKAVPKEMLPIVDKPSIQYIVEEMVDSGIEEILIITGRSKYAIEDHFDKSPELEYHLAEKNKTDYLKMIENISEMAKIFSVRQKEAKGLGHAVLCAKEFVGNEPFGVILGDDIVYNPEYPALKQLVDVYDKHQCSVLGVQTVPHADVCKYGIIDGNEIEANTYKVNNMVEKPSVEEAPTDVAILGRYVITPDIFEILENTPKGAGGEIQLTDGLYKLAERGEMIAYDFSGKRYDVGNKLGYIQATVEFGLRDDSLKYELEEYLKNLMFNQK
jgi:UTP--glucose-1-phosphate uridylyltransferase